jgi:hypothetical protein
MSRWRPPHPARTTPAPTPCPGGPRFRTRQLATAALGINPSGLTAQPCAHGCAGWHIVTKEPA